MDEVEIYKQTLNRQTDRIATLTLDLDLALTQLSMANEEIKALKNPENNQSGENNQLNKETKNSDKEKDSK